MNVHANILQGQPLVIVVRSNLYWRITLILRFKIENIVIPKNVQSKMTLISKLCIPSLQENSEFFVVRRNCFFSALA